MPAHNKSISSDQKRLLASLDLSPEQQELLLGLLVKAESKTVQEFLELVTEDSRCAKILCDNINLKRKAFEQNDTAAWDSVLRSEIEALRTFIEK